MITVNYANLPENFLYIPSSVTGTVTVTTSNGKTDTATVTIHNDDYSLNPSTGDLGVYDITLKQGESYTFEPSVFPEECMEQLHLDTENTMDAISVDGMTITAQNEGSATIYLNGWGYEKTKCKVYVEPDEIEQDNHANQVLLNVPYVTIEPGESFQFTAQLVPEDSTDNVTWISSNSSIVTIDSNGLVQGLTERMTLITATADGGASVVCSVTVEKEEVETSVTLDTVGMSFNVGVSNQLTATVVPATDSVTWTTSNASVASVDQNGKVTGIGKGSCVITATSSSGATGTCEITIFETEQESSGDTDSGTDTGNKIVSSITLNKSSLTLVKGQTSTDLKVSKLVSASQTVTYSSSNSKIAKVNSKTGKITAVATGTVTITVKNQEGNRDTCSVKVKAGKIKLNASSIKIQKGKTVKTLELSSNKYSADEIKSVKSSNSKIVKVSYKNGVITIKGKKVSSKKVTITVTMKSGATAKCKVKVQKGTVKTKKIKLNAKKKTLSKGKTFTLQITRKPISANDKITYKSSNKKVATVTSKGKIKAKSPGTATITVKSASGKTAKCKITVSGITLNKTSITLVKGQKSKKLKVSKLVSSSKSVTYSSSNSKIAKVNAKTGKITALKTGTVTITVTNKEGNKDTCKIKVKAGKIKLNKKTIKLSKGETIKTLKLSSNKYSADKIASVTSSNSKIVKVTYKKGVIKIKALKKSSKKITITVKMKSGATAKCKIKIN